MGRRRKSGLDELALWPWQLGLLAGVFAFLLIRYGIGAWLSTAGGHRLAPLGQQFGGMIAPLAKCGGWSTTIARMPSTLPASGISLPMQRRSPEVSRSA